MSSLDLPRLPEMGFTFDYVPFGEAQELVGTCLECRRPQRTGLLLGEEVAEPIIARVKDRLQRYHSCPATALAHLADTQGIDVVMGVFGFPDWLRPEPPPSSHRPSTSRMRDDTGT